MRCWGCGAGDTASGAGCRERLGREKQGKSRTRCKSLALLYNSVMLELPPPVDAQLTGVNVCTSSSSHPRKSSDVALH